MRYVIVGTAGHVDHGKTLLIKTLTGIDTDRLREEKERGISIELGFAYLDLPSGTRAGIVDVPGHERFIKNMLAGVGGIDIVLLVIAADEGVMPQTKEHLEIIELLRIQRGIVVLTKVDLVDGEWLMLVREDVSETLRGTVLEKAPIVAVSSVTREGFPELIATIDKLAGEVPEKNPAGSARLPIDRAFSVTGFGTVVTGTLITGTLRVGETVEILPEGLQARIRSLQVHKQKVDQTGPGHRVAVNLVGVEVNEVRRGQVLVTPGSLQASYRVDARVEVLADAPRPLKNRSRIRFYLGAAEILGRLIVLDRDEIGPGEEAYVQLVFEEPSVAAKGDRFVLRSYSPMYTIGGGTVIDPNPKRHRRHRQDIIEALETLEKGSPEDVVRQTLRLRAVPLRSHDVEEATGLDGETVDGILAELDVQDLVFSFPCEGHVLFLDREVADSWQERVVETVSAYCRTYPLRDGFPKEELRSRLFAAINSKVFNCFLHALADREMITVLDKYVRPYGDWVIPGQYQEKIDFLLKEFLDAGIQTPTWAEACAKAGVSEKDVPEYLHYILQRGWLIKLPGDIIIHKETLERAKEAIAEHIKAHGEISLGEVRDLLQTSRKYALPLLEYLDQIRFTKRVGDLRKLARS